MHIWQNGLKRPLWLGNKTGSTTEVTKFKIVINKNL